jgi:putative phosphoribosyl transferase
MTRSAVAVPTIPVSIDADAILLQGDLRVPHPATGLVVFAHGSGSSRLSPRNRFVAEVLVEAGLGTLLVDLLNVAEERDRSNVFDIGLLSHRLLEITLWVATREDTRNLAIGYFGASTGAAAALTAAARSSIPIGAVVSRGGRPDLAGRWLPKVTSPTLLLVGELDGVVLDLNRTAYARLQGEKRLEVIPGASHLFEERGTLEAAAASSSEWFRRFLNADPAS